MSAELALLVSGIASALLANYSYSRLKAFEIRRAIARNSCQNESYLPMVRFLRRMGTLPEENLTNGFTIDFLNEVMKQKYPDYVNIETITNLIEYLQTAGLIKREGEQYRFDDESLVHIMISADSA